MLEDREVLETVIKQSGLSARQFAVDKLLRDERTIRRWLAGKQPIPHPVMTKLLEWME